MAVQMPFEVPLIEVFPQGLEKHLDRRARPVCRNPVGAESKRSVRSSEF